MVSAQNSLDVGTTHLQNTTQWKLLANCDWTIRFGEEIENKQLKRLRKTMCDQVEHLVVSLEKIYAEWIRTMKWEDCTQEFEDLSHSRSHFRNLIKQFWHSTECGNQTLSVSSTSVEDKVPKETLIDTANRTIENAEENVEVSCRNFATQAENKPVPPTRDRQKVDRSTK